MNHIVLPKQNKGGEYYLSFSQISLWLSSPESYRKRYYGEGSKLSSDYLSFGKKIATALEQKDITDPLLQKVPRYDTPEQPIRVDFSGFVLIGFIDTFDSKNLRFREYKTGVRTKTGKPAWNIQKVYTHLQLPIYSLAIQEMFGSVEDVCHLDWIETKSGRIKEINAGGAILKNTRKNLHLTGHIESFARTITQKERDDTKAMIIKVASEINKDYELYR